jgi:hypothetical protein
VGAVSGVTAWRDSASLFMVEKEEKILTSILKGLRCALSVAFSQKASDSYMNAIDGAMVAVQDRLHLLAQESKSDS